MLTMQTLLLALAALQAANGALLQPKQLEVSGRLVFSPRPDDLPAGAVATVTVLENPAKGEKFNVTIAELDSDNSAPFALSFPVTVRPQVGVKAMFALVASCDTSAGLYFTKLFRFLWFDFTTYQFTNVDLVLRLKEAEEDEEEGPDRPIRVSGRLQFKERPQGLADDATIVLQMLYVSKVDAPSQQLAEVRVPASEIGDDLSAPYQLAGDVPGETPFNNLAVAIRARLRTASAVYFNEALPVPLQPGVGNYTGVDVEMVKRSRG